METNLNTVLNVVLSLGLPVAGPTGAATIMAIREFQAQMNLPVTGELDKDTEDMLLRAYRTKKFVLGEPKKRLKKKGGYLLVAAIVIFFLWRS